MPGEKYEVSVQKGRPLWKIVAGLLFSHLGLLIICILYSVVGAILFIELELPAEKSRHELKINKTKDVANAINYLKSAFWHYANNRNRYNYTAPQFRQAVQTDLDTLKKFVINYYHEYGYDMTEDWDYSWTFPKAWLFTITIMTTIGYGHIVLRTDNGRLFCMLYALIGIPLLLIFMANIGDLMAHAFRWMYSRLCCRWCRVRRRDNELPPDDAPRTPGQAVASDEVGKESYMPTDEVNVPITVNLMLITTFLFVGAVAFSQWEDNWDLGSSLYFCFVTLATIGFGDMVPAKSFFAFTEKGFVGFLQMAFVLVYIIFGMALLSMCINLMQEQLMGKLTWFAAKIGLGRRSNEETEIVKVSKEDRILQTPAGKTGNELDFNQKRRRT